MSSTSNFWTPSSKVIFHKKVVDLYNWNREPCSAEDYRCRSVEESDLYVLLHREEQHIADHIAFLAQSEEGARTVSAATVEEDEGGTGLTIRLAGNQTPSKEVLRGLKEILDIVEAYATKARLREKYCEALFDRVVTFSCNRIHERLRSKRAPRPWWIPLNRPFQPLHSRVRKRLQALRASSRTSIQDLSTLCNGLEELARCYEDVDCTHSEDEEHELLKTVVRKSFSISTLWDKKSLEEHLKSLGFSVAVYQNRAVLEIDKIARYLSLCKDLIRFSRQPSYRPLFSNIKLEHCVAPGPTRPEGASKPCHVHGEVQLILYYEQYPHNPPPRAIGSSKSACFLCDLFVKKHGHYRVSHSHKRLYHQWTMPDVFWMTEGQAGRFRDIVLAMIAELKWLRKTCRQQRKGEFNGFESRAHLLTKTPLLSATSTPSELSQRTYSLNGLPTPPVTPLNNDAKTITSPGTASLMDSDIKTIAASDAVSLISVARNDLPFSQPILLTTPSLHLRVDKLSFTFEFVEVLSGRLSIAQAEDALVWHQDCQIVNIMDIPTTSEMRLNCLHGSSELIIRFQNDQKGVICICLVWDGAMDNFS